MLHTIYQKVQEYINKQIIKSKLKITTNCSTPQASKAIKGVSYYNYFENLGELLEAQRGGMWPTNLTSHKRFWYVKPSWWMCFCINFVT